MNKKLYEMMYEYIGERRPKLLAEMISISKEEDQ